MCIRDRRYDLTLPLSRYYAANRNELPNPFKVIQTDRVYRAERPQKGLSLIHIYGVGQAVRSRASCHVIRVQGTARAAAGSNGEVLLAVFPVSYTHL